MFKKIAATFLTVIFSAMLTGCGADISNDLNSDLNSITDPNTNNSSGQNSDYSNNDNKAEISQDQAKEIALKDADAEEIKITNYEIKLNNENGTLMYEISFDFNGKEYDYDINAKTGEIISSKNEIAD